MRIVHRFKSGSVAVAVEEVLKTIGGLTVSIERSSLAIAYTEFSEEASFMFAVDEGSMEAKLGLHHTGFTLMVGDTQKVADQILEILSAHFITGHIHHKPLGNDAPPEVIFVTGIDIEGYFFILGPKAPAATA